MNAYMETKEILRYLIPAELEARDGHQNTKSQRSTHLCTSTVEMDSAWYTMGMVNCRGARRFEHAHNANMAEPGNLRCQKTLITAGQALTKQL